MLRLRSAVRANTNTVNDGAVLVGVALLKENWLIGCSRRVWSMMGFSTTKRALFWDLLRYNVCWGALFGL